MYRLRPILRSIPRPVVQYRSFTVPRRAYSITPRLFANKAQADIVIEDLTELYATARDEFEIAMEETEKASVYAEGDREAAKEELGKLQDAYKKIIEGEDKDLAEQIKQKRPYVIATKSGERVIQDPQVTISRVYLYFYMMINMGSLAGGIGMVYAERYIGFWLSYAMPTFLFFAAPLVLMACKKRYTLSPPTGSVLSRAIKLFSLASKGSFSANPVTTYRNLSRDDFWESVKPSRLGSNMPAWMEGVDDAWVDQVARGLAACKVFLWLPLYWLAYSQMTNNLTSQSATMQLHGVPNDLINNLNPITLVIFIPLVDFLLYPALRRRHIRFPPIKRIVSLIHADRLGKTKANVCCRHGASSSPPPP